MKIKVLPLQNRLVPWEKRCLIAMRWTPNMVGMCLITWRWEEPLKERKADIRLTLTGFCFFAVPCMVFAEEKRSRWHKTENKKPKRSHGHHLCLPQLVHSPGINGRGKLCRMPWLTILCKIPDCCLLCCEIMHMLEWKQQTIVFCKSCSLFC